MLPSYTQLGMAALLPSKELTFAESGAVLADGKSTVGRENREKVLKSALDGKLLLSMRRPSTTRRSMT